MFQEWNASKAGPRHHHTVAEWLTLNMLNCFKNHMRYSHISNCILDFARSKYMKLTLEKQHLLSFPHGQFHAYWYSGHFWSHGNSRHGIYPQSQNIPSPASEELTSVNCSCAFIPPPNRHSINVIGWTGMLSNAINTMCFVLLLVWYQFLTDSRDIFTLSCRADSVALANSKITPMLVK